MRRNTAENNPGASRHGNFINYYRFHPAEERLCQLPRGGTIWRARSSDRKYVGIDIGCNAGELTLALHDFLKDNVEGLIDDSAVSLLGLDLDPVLIERATEERGDKEARATNPPDVVFDCVDIMSPEGVKTASEYLATKGRDLFDVAFCFSITMWIHLNHGDAGLERFLKTACDISRRIVVEPQPWKCYRTASRRLKRANTSGFPLMDGIRYREDVDAQVEKILADNCRFAKLSVSDRDPRWGRKIIIYERKGDN